MNTIKVVVTAQDITHTQTYTVVVTRGPAIVSDTWSLVPHRDRPRRPVPAAVPLLRQNRATARPPTSRHYNTFIQETGRRRPP